MTARTAAGTGPVVHPAEEAPPLVLRALSTSAAYRSWEPTQPYLVDVPGLGVCRVARVNVDDYRRGDLGRLDRIRVGYTLHPQTKRLVDHNGRSPVYFELWAQGTRRAGREVLEGRVVDAALMVLAERDREEEARKAAAARRVEEQQHLTTRAKRLGVDLAWTRDGDPVLTRDLLAAFLTVAEEAQ